MKHTLNSPRGGIVALVLVVTLIGVMPLSAQAADEPAATTSILMPGAEIVKLADFPGLCDGPAYDGHYAMYIPDVKDGKLLRYIPKTNKVDVVLPEAGRISATFYTLGKLYLSDNGNSQITWLNGKEQVRLGGHDPADKKMHPNDLVVDVHGGVYYTLTGAGQVWYIPPGGEPQVAVDKITTPNGITMSPDGSTLYVAAYVPKEIWAYPITEPGKVGDGKVLAKMDDGPDKGADGMTIDRAGNVYCAGPHDVWVWSPSGRLLDKITPPTRPINASFGGPDPQELYITCLGDAKNNMPSALYKVATRINGVSPAPPTAAAESDANSKSPSTAVPDNIDAWINVPYASYGDRKVLMDVFAPKTEAGVKEAARPTIVVVHGGGWMKGDKTKFRALAIALAQRGYVAAAIEYRLGYEAMFPAAIHDCNAAVRYLRVNAAKYGVDRNRLGAVGGSAGGHLVGLMATGWKVKELQGDGGSADATSRLKAAVVMAGPLEIDTGPVAERSLTGKGYANDWIGGTVETNAAGYRLASAYRYIDADSPPILFMRGEHDNPTADQNSIDALKAAGVWADIKIYKDGKHGCWNQLPWFNDMVADMDAFFQDKLGAGGSK